MEKKTINLKEASFTQAINISAQWCKEWSEDLLSEEVLADRIAELTKTRNGLRGFFAYALSDKAYAKNPLSPLLVLISSAILSAKTSSLSKSSPHSLHHWKDMFNACLKETSFRFMVFFFIFDQNFIIDVLKVSDQL